MKENSIDRRIKYTKKVLKDALVELMQENHISRISVKSLCEAADVNRSTFYAHYKDQYDLLYQLEQDVLDNLKHTLAGQSFEDERPISVPVLIIILEYVKKNDKLCKVLLSENSDYRFQKDLMDIAQIVSFQIAPSHSERTQEYLTIYAINGCLSILQKWLNDGMIETPEQISKTLLQALYNGIISFQ